jgi:hypothetical protein
MLADESKPILEDLHRILIIARVSWLRGFEYIRSEAVSAHDYWTFEEGGKTDCGPICFFT